LFLPLLLQHLFYAQGDLFNHESLVKAIKGTDIIISAVGPRQLAEQTRIVTAIKDAGDVKVRLSTRLLI
jgi:putative NADH-flavin reductase